MVPTREKLTCEILTQESCSEYHNIFGSNQLEPASNKNMLKPTHHAHPVPNQIQVGDTHQPFIGIIL